LVLILVLLMVWAALVVLLWVGTLWFQGYIYSEPVDDIYWRAPAAGTALALLVALWCYLYHRAPERYERLFAFSPRQVTEFPVPREAKEPASFWSERGGKRTLFERRKTEGQPEYRNPQNRNQKWEPSDAIIVKENGQEVRFEPDRDAKGNFKRERSQPPKGLGWLVGPGPEQPLRYHDARGRVMTENDIGRLSLFRWGVFLVYLLLNTIHFLLWFVCLWLLLRFQWSHALGLAVVFWLVMTIVILPMLLDAARPRPATTPTRVAVSRPRHPLVPKLCLGTRGREEVDAYRMCIMSPSFTT
jgi:hypothetical protein